jgi:hypothetical protein
MSAAALATWDASTPCPEPRHGKPALAVITVPPFGASGSPRSRSRVAVHRKPLEACYGVLRLRPPPGSPAVALAAMMPAWVSGSWRSARWSTNPALRWLR